MEFNIKVDSELLENPIVPHLSQLPATDLYPGNGMIFTLSEQSEFDISIDSAEEFSITIGS